MSRIRFRGRLKRIERIETLEDCVHDLAIELGGYVQIWRSAAPREMPAAEGQARRVVRGLTLDLCPGLATVPLLISPEGALIPRAAVTAAETEAPAELPWISIQTGYAPALAHAALIEALMLAAEKFLADFELEEDTGYWPGRDLAALRRTLGDEVPEGFAAPGALTWQEHFQHVMETVQRTLTRPPEHAPVRMFEDQEDGSTRTGRESDWDAFRKEQLRRQAGLLRAMEERTLQDMEPGEAFARSLRDEGIGALPGEPDAAADELAFLQAQAESAEEQAWDTDDEDDGADASLEASLGEDGESEDDFGDEDEDDEDDGFPEAGDSARWERPTRHPLLIRAQELTMLVLKDLEGGGETPFTDQLVRGVMEASGGLSQVYHRAAFEGDPEEDDPLSYGHRLMQLKRAMQGVQFARGALRPAKEAEALPDAIHQPLYEALPALAAELWAEMEATRARLDG